MSVRSRQQGISLVEVLVVIVILLIGIFSVVRLFPGGFLVNRWSGENTAATRLAKAEMDRQVALRAKLCEAIVPIAYDAASGTLVIGNDTDPDDLSDVTQAPADLPAYYLSNINRIRRILGETVRIPVGMPAAFGSGSIYMLANGPIYAPRVGDTFAGITVYGAGMARREMEIGEQEPPYVWGANQYAIDYGGLQGQPEQAQIAFGTVGFARRFRIKYSYYDQEDNFAVKSAVVDFPDSRDAGYDPDPTDATKRVLPASYDGSPIQMVRFKADGSSVPLLLVHGSEEVSREFRQLPVVTASDSISWGDDAYQFRVFQDANAPAGVANLGVLVFNPRGRDLTEATTSGARPLTARIDYDVLDWRIIREDRSMPGAAPYRFSLGLGSVQKVGDLLDDQSRYTGMFPGGNSADVVVCDVSNGSVVTPDNYAVNYDEGTITFDPVFGDNHASGSFRIMYKAHGGWGVQIQKAVSRLTRSYAMPPPFGSYTIGLHRFPGNPVPQPVIYVGICEAGKTYSVREFYYAVGGSTDAQRGQNETYRVKTRAELIAAGDDYEVVGGRPLTWMAISDRHPGCTGWGSGQGVEPIQGVEGVSFKVRVVHDSGTRVTQTSEGNVVRARYRKFDLDTILTPRSD